MKTYNTMTNIGRAKYMVNFHDGIKTNKDGSPFFDCKLFSNKKKLAKFVRDLCSNGYTER